jgi:ABC-type transport system involved in multi-copper enzyme maturation permease subunit
MTDTASSLSNPRADQAGSKAQAAAPAGASAVWAVAANTLRQTVRERLFYNIVVFGVGLILLAIIVASLTFGYPERTIRSIGLSGVSIALDLMALLVGVTLVHQEIDRKTLFVVLTRPIHRWQYVLGRYLGLVLATSVAALGLSLVMMLSFSLTSGSPTLQDLLTLSASLVECFLIGAIGVVLSSFSTPTLSAGIGLGIWIAGTTTDDLVQLAAKSDPITRGLCSAAYYVLPALARLNFREAAVYQLSIAPGDYLSAIAYGFLYSAGLVALASVILNRREMV